MEQLQTLENTRTAIRKQLQQMPSGASQRPILESQVDELNVRIATVDGMLANSQGLLAGGGTSVISVPPRQPDRVLPQDIFMLSGVFMVCVFLPLSVAIARRIWRSGVKKVASIPSDIAERLGRMELSIESSAIEIERIGEGQRYLTRLLGERKPGDEVELPRIDARDRIAAP